MSAAFERFLAGEDRLTALLRDLPEFEVPSRLEQEFLAAAQAAQARFEALQSDGVVAFEPPPSLEASFLKLAAGVDAAQSGRRDALLEEISQGQSPAQALGGDVRAETAAWLARRAQESAARKAAAEAAQAAKPRRPDSWLWRGVGLAVTAGVLAAFATQLFLDRSPATGGLALQESSEAKQTDSAAPASSVMRTPAPAQAAIPQSSKGAPVSNAPQTKLADAAQQGAAEADEAKEASKTGALQADQQASSNAEAPKPLQANPALRSEAQVADMASSSRMLSAAKAPALEGLAQERGAERVVKGEATAAPPRPAAEAMAAQENARARLAPPPAAPAAKAASAPASLAPASALEGEEEILRTSLSEDPARFATRLPRRVAGLSWELFSASPDQEEVRTWVEQLRAQLNLRGANIVLLRDSKLALGELQLRVPPEP